MKRIAMCWLATWLVVLSACGTQATPTRTANQAEQYASPAEVTGSIHIAGSSTVYPLTLRLAHALTVTGAPTNVVIDNVGTGGGFRAFCSGQAVDIVNASRPITANEQATCLDKEGQRHIRLFRRGGADRRSSAACEDGKDQRG